MTQESKSTEKKKYETYLQLASVRLKDFGQARIKLQAEAHRFGRTAKALRIGIIILGALVAIRSVVDQVMVNYKPTPEVRMWVDISFTLIGVVIAAIAGLQQGFKFEEKAAGVRELANRAQSHSRIFMANIDNPDADAQKMWGIVEQENTALNQLYSDAVSQGINLVSETDVEYSSLLTGLKQH